MAFDFGKKKKGPQGPPSLKVDIEAAPKATKKPSFLPKEKPVEAEDPTTDDSSEASFSCPSCGCKLGVTEKSGDDEQGTGGFDFGDDEQ